MLMYSLPSGGHCLLLLYLYALQHRQRNREREREREREKVSQVAALTQLRHDVALQLLQDAGFRVDHAIELYYSTPHRYIRRGRDGGGPVPAPRSLVDKKKLNNLFDHYRGTGLWIRICVSVVIIMEEGELFLKFVEKCNSGGSTWLATSK